MQESKQSVYKIYSRNRLKIFKPQKSTRAIRHDGKKIYLIFIIIIAIFVYARIWKSIDPIFESICKDEAMSIATKITNEESSKVLENYNYNDLFTIQKDEARKYTNDKC